MNANETKTQPEIKVITLEAWDAATTEQRSEWLRQGVLTDRPPTLPRYKKTTITNLFVGNQS